MKHHEKPITEAEFHEFIACGAARLTARDVHRLVAEMPDLREQFSRLRESAYPDAERQLWFLSEVVDRVWTEAHLDLPYGAALEAAFAVAYFVRETDLIPDSLGPIGLTDDIAVVQAVFARNAGAYEAFRAATKLDDADFNRAPARA
jgi:uncharacterized membrane protein YkvA (DUF1232 family)